MMPTHLTHLQGRRKKNPKQTEKRKETVPEGKGTEYQAKASV